MKDTGNGSCSTQRTFIRKFIGIIDKLYTTGNREAERHRQTKANESHANIPQKYGRQSSQKKDRQQTTCWEREGGSGA